MSTETETQQEETVINEPQITLGDFVLMSNIISTVARRGGFESKEFTIVGDLASRLETFIKANSPPTEEEQSPEGEVQGELELTLDSEGWLVTRTRSGQN